MNLYKNKQLKRMIAVIVALSMILPTATAMAAMQSASYVIYESVMHTFDGPVITNVASSVSGVTVTIGWDTNIVSDSFVVYDTNSGFTNSQEQGTSLKNYTSGASKHSVVLSGLSANTPYYYKVKSKRINGGESESASASFTTGSDGTTPPVVTPPSGGGILIIDKTDKKPPVITNVKINVASSTFVEVTWQTDEKSTSFLEYGEAKEYGSTFGSWNSVTDHKVILENLTPATAYHLRALSSDSWGNVGYSDDQTFITLTETGEAVKPGEIPVVKPEVIDQKILAEATKRMLDFLKKLFPEVSLNQLGQNPFTSVTSLDQIINFIPAPVMSGEPTMDVSATEAAIKWTTDIDANAVVAMTPSDKYNSKASEPYAQIVGNSDVYEKNHEVKLIGLTPNTLYHIQLRSKAKLGPTAKSKDFTFKTNLEVLQITSYFTQVVDQQTVIFKWVTNKNANSAVKIAPYLNNILAVDQSKTFKDDVSSVIHEIKVTEFAGGTTYEVELSSADDKGNTASKVLSNFSTGKDDLAPEISRIKVDSTIFLDKKDKTQTVISWGTNEPATSKIYYQEGVHGGDSKLSESTGLNENYNKDHIIVVTKFKPGTVYTFRIESADSSGNLTLSLPHTFMTAKQKESIIQVIMRILENTFGWMKKIGA
jgi:hypothetical protein